MEGRVPRVNDAVVVSGKRHAACELVVWRRVLGRRDPEGDRFGFVKDDGAGFLQEPDVLVEDWAAGLSSDFVRLVHGSHVVAAPGAGFLKVVPDELAGPLAFSRTGTALSQGPGSSAGYKDWPARILLLNHG